MNGGMDDDDDQDMSGSEKGSKRESGSAHTP
jgi:hypothetical protein